MDTDALLDSAINYITSIFSQNTDGHDTEHSLRVYHYAAKLAAHYPEAKKLALKKHAYMKKYVHALEKGLSFSQYSDNSGY